MYNKRETEILLKLVSNKEEWTRIGITTLKHDEVLKLIKDGLVEVSGKDMRITDLGRNFLKEIEKS